VTHTHIKQLSNQCPPTSRVASAAGRLRSSPVTGKWLRGSGSLPIIPFFGRDAMKNNFVHSEGSRVYKRVHSGGQNGNPR
jgi:hypothetical protein